MIMMIVEITIRSLMIAPWSGSGEDRIRTDLHLLAAQSDAN